MKRRFRYIKAALLVTTFIGTPGLAQADPISLTALVATAAGAAVTSAVSSAVLGAVLGALVTAAITFAGQQLFGAQSVEQQREGRTREFNPHPLFRFAFGEFPQEGSVVFHHTKGNWYYVVYLLNSIPSEAVDKIEVWDGIELGWADLSLAYDMSTEAEINSVWPWFAEGGAHIRLNIGLGEHTQPPDIWLDNIGDQIEATDVWKGATVAFVRFAYGGDPDNIQKRWGRGAPPALRFFGRWSKLYDPRKDPNSGVTQYVSGAHDPDDRTTWEYSSNPALAGLMLAFHDKALGRDKEIIPIQQWADAADDCDDAWSSDAELGNNADSLKLLGNFNGTSGTDHPPLDTPDGMKLEFQNGRGIVGELSDAQVYEGSTSVRVVSDSTWGGPHLSDDDLNANLMPDDGEFRFTIAAWIDVLETPRTETIISNYDSSSVRSYRLRVLADKSVEFTAHGVNGNVGTTVSHSDTVTLTSATGVIADGQWHKYQVERSGDDWYLRVDDTVVASELGRTFTISSGSTHLKEMRLGYWENNRDPFAGYMDAWEMIVGEPITDIPGPWGCNGMVRIESRELDLLDPVLDSMAGHLDTTGGLLGVRAGVWVAPTDSLTQPVSDEVEVLGARDAGFDMVRAKFLGAHRDWQPTDGEGYALRDGARVQPLELPLVANAEQAQKLEKIAALRAEPNRVVTATWDGREAARRLGERVNFALPGMARAEGTYVIDSKELVTQEVDDGFEVAVKMRLREDLAATYEFTASDLTDVEITEAATPGATELAAPDSVTLVQADYRSAAGATARLKITVEIDNELALAADELRVELTDGGGYKFLTVIEVETDFLDAPDGTQTYSVFSGDVSVGVTYTARARAQAIDRGASDWTTSGSVTVATPVLDYSDADYSPEYA